MAHQPQIISINSTSDGAITIVVRCCDDPKTDSVHTEYFAADTDLVAVQTNIETHKTRVANLHAANQKIKEFLATL